MPRVTDWLPPVQDHSLPLRRQRSQAEWRVAIELIARKHGIFPCELEPYEQGETQVREAAHGPLVPLHTELSEQHVYVEERRGQLELSGLLDFADARLGPAQYEIGCLVEFLFRGERGLLREFLLAYGVPEADLTVSYSESLLAWCLCGRFNKLNRMLSLVAPWVPESLEALAARLFALDAGAVR